MISFCRGKHKEKWVEGESEVLLPGKSSPSMQLPQLVHLLLDEKHLCADLLLEVDVSGWHRARHLDGVGGSPVLGSQQPICRPVNADTQR